MQFVNLPLTINEGIYTSIAQKLAQGGRLYVDAWDHKPPFILWAYYFAGLITNNVELQAHGLAILAHLACACLIGSISKQFGASTKGSWAAGGIYLLWALPPAFQSWSGQADLLMQPFLLAALLLALRPRRFKWFVAGILWAAAFFFKQSALFYLPAFIYLGWDDALVLLPDFFWGVNALSFVVVAPFAFSGRLGAFWQAVMGVNGTYVGEGWSELFNRPEFHDRLLNLFSSGFWTYGFSFLAMAGVLLRARSKEKASDARIKSSALLLFALCSLLACSASGAFYSYYFVAVLPGLALLVPVCLMRLKGRTAWQTGMFLAAMTLPEIAAVCRYVSDPDSMLLQAEYSRVRMEAAKDVGIYIQQNAVEGDTLTVWAAEPQIYSYSGIPFHDVISPLIGHLYLIPGEENRFQNKLVANPPTWLVIGHGNTTPPVPTYLAELTEHRYYRKGMVGTKEIYKKI